MVQKHTEKLYLIPSENYAIIVILKQHNSSQWQTKLMSSLHNSLDTNVFIFLKLKCIEILQNESSAILSVNYFHNNVNSELNIPSGEYPLQDYFPT